MPSASRIRIVPRIIPWTFRSVYTVLFKSIGTLDETDS